MTDFKCVCCDIILTCLFYYPFIEIAKRVQKSCEWTICPLLCMIQRPKSELNRMHVNVSENLSIKAICIEENFKY